LTLEGVDLRAQVVPYRIVLGEGKHNHGLEEVRHILVVAFAARVVVHLLGGLRDVEEGVSSIVAAVVVGVDGIAGSRRKRSYC